MDKLTHPPQGFKTTRRRIFPRPTLSRYERIRRRSACTWSNRERVFLELADLYEAYPRQFAQGLHDLYEQLRPDGWAAAA